MVYCTESSQWVLKCSKQRLLLACAAWREGGLQQAHQISQPANKLTYRKILFTLKQNMQLPVSSNLCLIFRQNSCFSKMG